MQHLTEGWSLQRKSRKLHGYDCIILAFKTANNLLHPFLQLTAIAYANPGWADTDGGKLRLWPPQSCSVQLRAGCNPVSTESACETYTYINIPYALVDLHPSWPQAFMLDSAHHVPNLACHCKPRRGQQPFHGVLHGVLHPVSLYRDAENGAGPPAAVMKDHPSFVDIAPIAGRLVVFLSGAVEHAVLPAISDRVALTCWLH